MKLIFLYGPPASGKLTVARILADRTGYKLLHNHQTFDLLEPVFGAHHPHFAPLLNRLRLQIITAAAESGFDGLIVTHVYGAEEQPFIQDVEAAVVKRGGQAHFVRLEAHPEELERRVVHQSRHEFKKLRTAEELRALLKNWDVMQKIPGVYTHNIDNTNLSPEETAGFILDLPALRD
jgi:hypothetical protein